ncbi:MAG: arginine deiminase-related protein [Ornithinimicrobium sp.]|uniref:citrulline utilization hydrolase CtlX n=1 Tax=Ornithinimicrobium sp. TaxID=1977084 RepID=UPI0026DF8843|nr:arginine deiminase-related protein [Ornithinimicrobium sp.]MDO5738524.1 arginine deiminase-related protein [Ornithinimicrobium sp.]
MTLAPERHEAVFPEPTQTHAAMQAAPAPVTLQAPRSVLMVRPHHFTPNPQTMVDNEFMTVPTESAREVARSAFLEVTRMAEQLRQAGVDVYLMEDEARATPDSVFPNNWFTTHADGSLAIFPMRSTVRRWERRADILSGLHRQFEITKTRDYSAWEEVGRYLEGTGAMVLDHLHKIAYVCRSARADEKILQSFCLDHGYRSVVFDATDSAGVPIYHTNVMMAVGTHLAIVTLDTVRDPDQRARLVHDLDESGREVVSITEEQMGEFAGNALEVWAGDHPLLVISSRGWASLRSEQRRRLEAGHEVLPVDVPTIEHAGGSARCMLAGLHAPLRQS